MGYRAEKTGRGRMEQLCPCPIRGVSWFVAVTTWTQRHSGAAGEDRARGEEASPL